MDVKIRAVDFQLTPTINDYVEEKLMSIRHMLGSGDTPARCEIELGKTMGGQRHGGDVWFAEINLTEAKGQNFFARAQGENIHAAVDLVKDEILMQIRKHKRADRGVLRRSGVMLKRLLRRD